jgi:hypothetical protein
MGSGATCKYIHVPYLPTVKPNDMSKKDNIISKKGRNFLAINLLF